MAAAEIAALSGQAADPKKTTVIMLAEAEDSANVTDADRHYC